MKIRNFNHWAILLGALLLVSSCSRTAQVDPIFGTPGPAPVSPIVAPIAPVVRTVEIVNFVEAQAFAQLSEMDKTLAANAQFNALQFGRPGAPRTWEGSNAVSGKVTVGPFVRENGLECRSFEHAVTIDQVTHTRNGSACRGNDSRWQAQS